MHSTTTLFITLLPLLGVEAKSYRGGHRSGSGGQSAMLMASNAQTNSLDGVNQLGDTQPGTQCSNGGNTNNAGAAAGCNDCGVSSFVELSTDPDSNPLVNDCQQMIANIKADQEWTVTASNRNIVSYGSCFFNAVAPNGGQANIGNADVIDLVSDSIKKYAKNGHVGCQGGYSQTVTSAGTMPCDNAEVEGGQQVQIDWTLTSTSPDGSGSSGSGGQFWPGTGGQGGVSNGGHSNDFWNTNQGGHSSHQNNGDDTWDNYQESSHGNNENFNSFDVNDFQNGKSGNPGQIQKRDGKSYKVVKW
ncbi:hypothetical protein HII31_07865 [Pseudocercospora fuligena]|uniref:Ecp2 effector protein-like domain-containing protein n=1 Tax=Pseudocercospora fuligena TaxID=685502 RepID=A0A8H6RGL2_9PEZI|nr:hypothetical protein HII31_07865 [Pseudocercospora fuligena]